MAGRLGIIAGQGSYPLALAERAKAEGEAPFILVIDGQADADFSQFETASSPLGQTARIVRLLQEAGCQRLLLAGKVTRPSMADLQPDAGALALLGKMALKGDDNALRVLTSWLEGQGFSMLAADSFLPRQSWPAGFVSGPAASAGQMADIRLALQALYQLDRLDVGQAVIAGQGRILAIEAAEGTDAMIARAKPFCTDGAVMVKMAKPSQDSQLDPPVIGLATIEALAAAGISLLAVEADRCHAADQRAEIEAAATAGKITLMSVSWSLLDKA
ncbi:MAG: UDP-2,3-diacylglucosamine diphosphatase LpxI [Alphaproteobacteria bacterium]|jgi:DUF1009 family protein|nr:UDP-2,3-diacylglucosamine diphosphatase LpxI [Alphaproteobacteria bacterium]